MKKKSDKQKDLDALKKDFEKARNIFVTGSAALLRSGYLLLSMPAPNSTSKRARCCAANLT